MLNLFYGAYKNQCNKIYSGFVISSVHIKLLVKLCVRCNFMNVSSSTSLSLNKITRKKNILNTFISELILMKIYMNATIYPRFSKSGKLSYALQKVKMLQKLTNLFFILLLLLVYFIGYLFS